MARIKTKSKKVALYNHIARQVLEYKKDNLDKTDEDIIRDFFKSKGDFGFTDLELLDCKYEVREYLKDGKLAEYVKPDIIFENKELIQISQFPSPHDSLESEKLFKSYPFKIGFDRNTSKTQLKTWIDENWIEIERFVEKYSGPSDRILNKKEINQKIHDVVANNLLLNNKDIRQKIKDETGVFLISSEISNIKSIENKRRKSNIK